MKVVYMCCPEFENGGLRERPLTENGRLPERPLNEKTRGILELKITSHGIFLKRGAFRSGPGRKRGVFRAAHAEKGCFRAAHTRTALIWEYHPHPPGYEHPLVCISFLPSNLI